MLRENFRSLLGRKSGKKIIIYIYLKSSFAFIATKQKGLWVKKMSLNKIFPQCIFFPLKDSVD